MQNIIKKTIIILIIIIFGLGVYFGYKFYKVSQGDLSDYNTVTNTNPTRTPFQTRVSTSTQSNDVQEGDEKSVENPTTNTTKTKLVQIWKEPVSGFDFVYKDIEEVATSTNNSTTSVIQAIKNKKIYKNQEFIYLWDRKTGNIYENLASTTDLNKLSYFTLIGAEEVLFIDNISAIIRKVSDDNETISTTYLKLIKDTATSTLYNANVGNINISSSNLSLSKETKRLFYFINNTGTGVLSSFDGGVRTNVLNTVLSEWLSQYVNKTTIALTTKPSAYFPGYLFFLNPDGKGKNTYIIGEKYGFNTLVSPDGKKVIYNEIINNTLETFIYDIKSKTNTYLSQATIVDKCVWSNDSKLIFCGIPQKLYQAPYPEAWYKNNIEFTDNIWSINPVNGEFKLIIPLQDMVSNSIDIYKIKISNTNKYLLFQDKNSLSLWKYEI